MPKKSQLPSHFDIAKTPGRPMLYWDGKRPLERVEYFPAQEKEVYGDKRATEINELFWGDNLQVLGHLMKDYRGRVDLIYIDPPFDSKADYVRSVKVRGEVVEGEQKNIFEERQYSDIWEKDEYLQFLYQRLILLRELLADTGSIYVHIDYRKAAFVRLVMDEIFGEESFVNEIIWHYDQGARGSENFAFKHDNIYCYAKNPKKHIFNYKDILVPYESGMTAWRYTRGGQAGKEMPEGKVPTDVWGMNFAEGEIVDVKFNAMSNERTDYPTQKPEALLERIIKASSRTGDLVLDCFLGSGTACAVAQKLGRRWIGCDINIGAIQTATKRLNQIIGAQMHDKKDAWLLPADEVAAAKKNTAFCFKVFNVNDYDVFKNELEAKEIIMEMYGVDKARMTFFDGVLDNNFVKVMPLNRVLSKQDVDLVLRGIRDNISTFEVKKKSRHGDPIYDQGVIALCSGLELDALDYLSKKNETGVTVDVRDILLDRQGVIFKKKPEADIRLKTKGNTVTLTVADFISPILMRKLELENNKALKKEAEAKVQDFRQIVDSVAIDIDYDGKLFNAEIIDVPAKNAVIQGEYAIEYSTKGVQKIAVKIVDVLGEEWFGTFEAKV